MKQGKVKLVESFDALAREYDEITDTLHHAISFYVTVENLKLELPDRRDISILDSGGGTGRFSLYLGKAGYSVTLCDISSESIAVAKEKAEIDNISFRAYVCDSEDTPFGDNTFDVIMMNGGVISYSPSPDRLLAESYRILKPGGILWFDFLNSLGWAIETVNAEDKADLALQEDQLIQMQDWEYPARVLSLDRVKQLVHGNSFRIKSLYGLVLLSNSLPLDVRYSKEYDEGLLKKYQEIELSLSRRPECIGSSWCCSICAIKL